MSQEIEDFVDDILGDLSDRMQEFLEEQDKKYQERAKLGVRISETWNGYDVLIGGHRIHVQHDSSIHKWYFRDEDYNVFMELSEKKGEAVIQFLQKFAKVLSPRSGAATEETIAKGPLDPAAENEEIIEEEEAMSE